ncbi:MFS transporter [Streptomyces sp. NPDC015127]|uniref:MFS transporter n=1 Tax=Streptomyces sp. NPDC015127 TaxID=3364939 RepID=UPI0037036497
MTTTVPRTPRSSKDPATDSGGPRLLLAAVLAAQFMALLDTFIVNAAAPTIRAELHTSGADLQLVVAGYTISYAVLLITGARLGAMLGHRRVFLGGLAAFTVFSLACGLAADTGQLIAFRFLQGAGAALMIPQVLSLIQRNFTAEGRVRALGAYSAVLASGAAAGQVLGGVLVSADLFGTSWRPVFLVNVPIGLALLLLGARVLPRDRQAGGARAGGLDLPGLVLLAAAVSLFTVPLVVGHEHDWPLWTWLSLVASAVTLGGLLAHEARLARRGGAPLISPRLLRSQGIGLAVLRIAAVMAVNAAFLFTVTLHVQGGLGYSALRAGLVFAPSAVVFGAVAMTWRRWPAAWQRALVPAGFVVTGLAGAAVGALLRDGGDGGPLLYAACVASGVGMAAAYSPTLTGALATVRQEDAADASGLLVTVTQLGQIIGVAAFGTLFLGRLTAPGPQGSADALWVTTLALAAACALGAVAGLVRKRR